MVRAGLVARVGGDPVDASSPDHVVVRIEETERGFLVSIAGVAGARTFTTTTCSEAVDQIEAQLAPLGAQPAWSPRPASPLPPLPPLPERPNKELALAFGSVSGSHPSSAVSYGLRVGYVLPRWRLGIEARIATNSGHLDTPTTQRTQTVELVAEGCARRWLALACVVAGVGSKSVRIDHDNGDFTSTNEADYRDPYGLVGASGAVELPLGRAFVRPAVEIAVPLPQVAIEAAGTQRAELSSVQLAFDLALGVRW